MAGLGALAAGLTLWAVYVWVPPPARAATGQPLIMYDSQQSPAGLWTRNLDGSDPQPFQAGAFEATWTATGSKLAFLGHEASCSTVGQSQPLYVESADRSGLTQLGEACLASISPDGQHIVFQPGADSLDVVSTVPGSQPVPLLPLPNNGCSNFTGVTENACYFPEQPSWRGNSTIVFASGVGGGGLWTIPSSGGTLSEIAGTETGFAWLGGTAGSFDGTSTAASGADSTSQGSIYTVASGSAPVEIAAPAAGTENQDVDPEWSFDGKTLAFEEYFRPSGTTSVYTVPSGGGTPTLISGTDTTAAFPTFAPPALPGTIAGAVTGKNNAPLSGVTVTATPQSGGAPVTTTTNNGGAYSLQVSATTYTVTPSGTPTGQEPDGHYTPTTCSGTKLSGACQVDVGPGATSTASFTYGTKNQLSGTITYAQGDKSAVQNMSVAISGTTTDGTAESTTVTTDATGHYTADLDPGNYTVTPDPKYMPIATASDDCNAAGATCKVNLDMDRTANFTVKCQPMLDFHTSMVATGCFVPMDAAAGTWKAQGAFRMDGVDFQSPDDSTDPVIFNDQKKTIAGSQVKFSLTAPGFGGGWLGFYVPGGLHLSFPFSEQKTTWVFRAPWATAGGVVSKSIGFLSAPFGGSQTLFGFPAHARAVELTFDPGQTTLQGQISFPPTTGAFLDPINGLWKIPNGRGGVKIDYPLAFRAKITATNAVGVSAIEGSVAFANVYGVDTTNNSFLAGKKGAPQIGTVELARLGFNWQLAQGVLHGTALLVIHSKGPAKAAEYAEKYLGPLNAFLGKVLVTVDASFKWVAALQVGSRSVPIPGLVNLNVQVNNINKYIPDTPGFFWQRFGLNGGIDVNNPLSPWTLGGNVGFTWLPRFKSDYLWFQELASLDGSVQFTFDPGFTFTGTTDLKVANATLIHGVTKLDNNGYSLEGTAGLDLNQILRVRFPAKISGTARLTFPAFSPSSWQLDAIGKINIWTMVGDGRFVMNARGAGLCVTTNTAGMQGAYFDGHWHVGGCDSGPFISATSSVGVGSNEGAGSLGPNDKAVDVGAAAVKVPSFTLSRVAHVSAVAVLGATAPPQFKLTGPRGLEMTTPIGGGAAFSHPVSLIVNASDRTTYIILRGAPHGRYRLTPLPGSSRVAGMRFAAMLRAPSVHARILTQGCRRVVEWRLRPLPGQRVIIEETDGASVRPLISTDTAHGTVAYAPTAGTATRQLIAVVQELGTPRAQLVLARVHPPSPTAAVTRLRAHRSHTKVRLRWAPVCAAAYYVVSPGTGAIATTTTASATSVTIGKAHHVTITVQAVSNGNRLGRPSRVKVA